MSEASINDSPPDVESETEQDPYTTEHFVSYRIVYPLIIAIGVVNNVICIIILLKPKMRIILANRYFLIQAVADLLVCVMSIPIAISSNGCFIDSYSTAIYYGYFGWSVLEILQPLSFYTLLFLAFDRFLAVWNVQYFRNHKKDKILMYRMAILLTIDILLHIFFFINVKISCLDENENPPCKPHQYVIQDAVRLNSTEIWHPVFFHFHEFLVRWLPGFSLIVFNIGLIIAIGRGKLNNSDVSNSDSKKMELSLTLTLIAMIFSTIIFIFPQAVYMTQFGELHPGKCYGDYELFRATTNVLQLLEHITLIVFLTMLNPNFRKELRNWIRKSFPCIGHPSNQVDIND
ncbi:probable G-protein coupled receptor B0563.6 isoform X2 [Palaemon carinicauda]